MEGTGEGGERGVPLEILPGGAAAAEAAVGASAGAAPADGSDVGAGGGCGGGDSPLLIEGARGGNSPEDVSLPPPKVGEIGPPATRPNEQSGEGAGGLPPSGPSVCGGGAMGGGGGGGGTEGV